MPAPASTWVPPETFEEYRLVRLLGRGGMGQVYLAHDTLLDRPVAVKFIATAVARSEAARQRFLIEARAAARLHHPNVVSVFRVGELRGLPYLISEFVRGESLDRLPKPVAWPRLLEIAIDLSRGLAAAHRRGVLHRDIKPGNAVLAETGEVKLLDFGLAKLLERGGPSGISNDSPRPEVPAIDDVEATLPTPSPEPRAISLDQTAMPETPTPDDAAHSGVTVAGALMGTPAYMSPESWRGHPATARSDVYSLGVLLYELSCGRPPHVAENAPMLGVIVIENDAPPLASRAPALDAAFAAVVDRCLARDPEARFASAEEVLDALELVVPGPLDTTRPTGNPYRGLAAFEAEHRALFFGRDAAIRGAVDRLHSDPFLLVTGDSGVGKSSLCRAGILPRVEKGGLGGREFQSITVLPGRRPVAAFASALAPILGEEHDSSVSESADEDPAEIARRVRKALGKRGLIVFVDQLEELITLADPPNARVAAELIAALASQGDQIRVLATVRGDFLTRLTALPALAREIERAIYLLAPLSGDQIREVIVGPAAATLTKFETPEMVETLIESTAGAQGGLPLLQFALADLWEARDPRTSTITAATLTALGGVEGALARHADQVIAALLPETRVAARRVMVRLVTAEGTRARRTEDELVGDDREARAALEALVRGRLVVAREDAYEVAHEALIASWKTLRDWLHDEGDRRAIRERLGTAATEWQRLARPRDTLWGKRQLEEAALLGEVSATESEFLHASRGAQRRRLILRIAIPALIVATAIAAYLLIRVQDRRETGARVAAHVTDADRELTRAAELAQQVDGLRADAFARFDASETTIAEERWAAALASQAELDLARSRASQALEAALIVDGSRGDVRDRLADALYHRALDAERWHQDVQRDELLQRLKLHDRGGALQRQWDAPGTLGVRTGPASAANVALLRYDADADGVRHAVPVRDLGATPIAAFELPRGSYLLQLTLEDGRVVPYPVLIGRAQEVEAVVVVPPSIPAGYVFVSAGTFLYGSNDNEEMRKGFFFAHPEHPRRVESFLIARNETTYADWIAFLEALSPAERDRYRPTVLNGSMDLRQVDGRWTLTLQPTATPYTASEGELITYPGRLQRAKQDWLQMPIVGVLLEDARAYAKWLRETGRLSTARLCDEVEWERAARGADDRQFPHGDGLLPDHANFDLTYGRTPSGFGPDVVGSYPASSSPFGVMDLAGNVWEWVESREGKTIRSGDYYRETVNARSVNRAAIEPTLRDPTVGLRICADG